MGQPSSLEELLVRDKPVPGQILLFCCLTGTVPYHMTSNAVLKILLGVSGFVVGGFAGVLRSSTPFLFALASGIQWATLGTSYWASRGAVLHAWSTETVTPDDRISASAIAGGISGICGGALSKQLISFIH